MYILKCRNSNFYTLPEVKSKRAAAFGYGTKYDFTKENKDKSQVFYNTSKGFNPESSHAPKYSFGISRNFFDKVYYESNKMIDKNVPGPAKYLTYKPFGSEAPKYSMTGKGIDIMKKVKSYPLIDFFLDSPLLFDSIMLPLLWVLSLYIPDLLMKLNLPAIKVFDKNTALTYMAYITSANVTLTGFIIAALTILITVKSSLKARGFTDAANAMEYIFSTDHYFNIVTVFVKSIVELFALFILLYGVWLLSGNISDKCFYRILILATIGIITAVFRVLFTLFSVLNLERLKRA